MHKKILVPVDLEHLEDLAKGLDTAVALAKAQDAELIYVGVYGGAPTPVARDETAFRAAMEDFAQKRAKKHGIKATALPLASHDTAIELTTLLLDAAEKTGADLIVMASHSPGWIEHLFHSNAGYIACHAPISVFVVR